MISYSDIAPRSGAASWSAYTITHRGRMRRQVSNYAVIIPSPVTGAVLHREFWVGDAILCSHSSSGSMVDGGIMWNLSPTGGWKTAVAPGGDAGEYPKTILKYYKVVWFHFLVLCGRYTLKHSLPYKSFLNFFFTKKRANVCRFTTLQERHCL